MSSNKRSFTNVICCFVVCIFANSVTSQKTQYLFVEVVVDSKNCSNNGDRWMTQQDIVFQTLKNHPELGLSFAGRYCHCKFSTKNICKSEHNKAVEMLLYESKTGSINANASTVSDLIKELDHVPPDVLKSVNASVQPFYDCSNLMIITETDPRYKACMNTNLRFTNPVSSDQANDSEPDSGLGIGAIVGMAFGILTVLGLVGAASWLLLRHLKQNQVNDEGSSSDITPIVPGLPDFGVATTSVAPAGTG